jgi:hypothetical protein
MGALLSPGTRTVTAALRVMGVSQDAPDQHDPRVLTRALWAGRAARHILLGLLVSTCAPTGTIVVGRDDTRERRRGETIPAQGLSRAPGRSAQAHCVQASGWRWLCLLLRGARPWAARGWALPLRTALGPSERSGTERGRAPRPLTARARQMLLVAARWRPERAIVGTADRSCAALARREAGREAVTVGTRGRREAAWDAPAPARYAGQRGRPRTQGKRGPTLEHVAAARQTTGPAGTGRAWDGAPQREVAVVPGPGVW